MIVQATEHHKDYQYKPCRTGLHVCGITPDGRNFFTVYNYRTATAELAQRMFDLYKAEFASEEDYLVDLFIDGCMMDNFSISKAKLHMMVER